METVDIDGTIVIGEGERDEAPMLYIGEKVGTRTRARGGHRGRPPRGHEPLRDRHPGRDRGAGRGRAGRAPPRARHLHGQARGARAPPAASVDIRAPVADNLKAIARRAQPRRGRPGGDRPRPPPPRAADRRHPQGRRPDPAHRGRRPLGRHLGRGVGHRRPRRHGHRRGAGGGAHRRGDAVPERRDPGPARPDPPLGRGPAAQDGDRRTSTASTGPRTSPPAGASSSRRPGSPTARC